MTKERPSPVHRYLLIGLFVLALAWTAWASLAQQASMPLANFPDKAAHTINYALLTILLSLAWRRLPPWLAVVCVVAFGGLLELAQLQTGYRHGEWLDMLANLAGAVSGATACWWYTRKRGVSGR